MSDHNFNGNAWVRTPGAYAAQRARTHGPAHGAQSVYVEMADGCRLAVDTFLPTGPGAAPHAGATYPTVVIFTPYCRRFATSAPGAEPSPNTAKYRDFFVPYGYAVVVVDMRGTGASFGRRIALRSPLERQDCAGIADWVVRQPWSNGVIGSTGISYLGAAACFLASTGHPAVKAIAPLFGVSDSYSEQLFPGGMLSRIWSRDYDELMTALDQNDREQIARFPYFNDERLQGPQPVDADTDGTLLRAAMAEHRDNLRLHDLMPEWQFRGEGPLHAPEMTTDTCSPFHYLLDGMAPGVAVYSISGWYDGGGYANGAISRYLTLAGPDDRLLLGPWDHGARTNISPWRDRVTPDFPVMDEVLRFFDQHLMGLDTGLAQEAPVHYFSVHAEQWRSAPGWPDAPRTRWFPSADSTLKTAPDAQRSTQGYQVSFTTETGRLTRWARLGAYNVDSYYPDWAGRDEALLNFTSEPLAEAMEITGHIEMTLNFRCDQPDAALFVYAAEVEADGGIRYITEGMLRVGHRRLSEAPAHYRTCWPYRSFTRADFALLPPGELHTAVFALLPVAWRLAAGSRLRISIGGADSRYFPQVPHGRPPLLDFELGGDRPCTISIPVGR